VIGRRRIGRRRRHPASPAPRASDVVAVIVSTDEPDARGPRLADVRARLRAIVAEALILQDQAEGVLRDISDRDPLAELAPRGGRLTSRFLELRRALPTCDDPATSRTIAVVASVLAHHAMLLDVSLQTLAHDWRSAEVRDQLDKLAGLGAPALWLEAVWSELP
jgi:hypothetical protein